MKICGVYKITNPLGAVYIGQSSDIKDRWRAHRGMKNNFERLLKESLRFHGVENHVFEVIEQCDKSILKMRERFHQEQYFLNGDTLLNLVLAKMDNYPTRCHPSTIKLLAERSIRVHTGLKRSEESKISMRKSAAYKSKPVLQFDLSMNLIAEFPSAHEAARNGFCRPRVSGCCNNSPECKTHKGFIWRYKIIT